MQVFAIYATTPRDAAIQELSQIRFPDEDRQIDSSTLWRWCKLAQVPTGLSAFDIEQCARLSRVASLRRQGYRAKQIRQFFSDRVAS